MVVRDLRGEGVAEPLFGPRLKVTALSVLTSRLRLYLSSFSLIALGVGLSSPAGVLVVKSVLRVEIEGKTHARLQRPCAARGEDSGFGRWCARAGFRIITISKEGQALVEGRE